MEVCVNLSSFWHKATLLFLLWSVVITVIAFDLLLSFLTQNSSQLSIFMNLNTKEI